MLIWFLLLGVTGAFSITSYPLILKAFNPYYAAMLLAKSPEWFLILGAVFLCTTGAEALYSDLGHCGRKNITISWLFVKVPYTSCPCRYGRHSSLCQARHIVVQSSFRV